MTVDVSDGFYAALSFATESNQTDVIKHLLHEGANVNRQTRYRNTPLTETPLHLAARKNNTEIARLLTDNGADVSLKDNINKTPLDVARKGSEVQRLLLLLQQSAP